MNWDRKMWKRIWIPLKTKVSYENYFYYLENFNMKISVLLFFNSSVNEKKNKYGIFLNVLLGGPILYKNSEP